MDNFLQEKRRWQQNFRIDIQKFMSGSQILYENIQFSPQIILKALNCGQHQNNIVKNGKINVQNLQQAVNVVNGQRLFGNRKQIRASQLSQLLNEFDLGQFNFKQQTKKHVFDGQALSIKKLDNIMSQQGFKILNNKDKSILIQCFDINKDGRVTQNDIQSLLQKLDIVRNKNSNKKQEYLNQQH